MAVSPTEMILFASLIPVMLIGTQFFSKALGPGPGPPPPPPSLEIFPPYLAVFGYNLKKKLETFLPNAL